ARRARAGSGVRARAPCRVRSTRHSLPRPRSRRRSFTARAAARARRRRIRFRGPACSLTGSNSPRGRASSHGRQGDGDRRVAWARTLTNLEPNGIYRFRFWAMNLYNDNPAALRVSFRPEPNWQFTQVPPSFHVQIAGCTWQQAEFLWTSNPNCWGAGQARTMTVIVENTTSGRTGADFALDDAADRGWYRCTITTPCGAVTSDTSLLKVIIGRVR